MNKNDIKDAATPLTSVGVWPRRVGLGLAILAVLAFIWPNVTGQNHIAGIGNIVIGRVLIIAAWVPLLLGIIQRARFQQKQSGNDPIKDD